MPFYYADIIRGQIGPLRVLNQHLLKGSIMTGQPSTANLSARELANFLCKKYGINISEAFSHVSTFCNLWHYRFTSLRDFDRFLIMLEQYGAP